ncbi:MAG: hypothetical protein [Avonheates virus Gas_1078]|uniref:hypothetical protein n=1 Tax=Avonheates virus Gas_1078 TaxID=2914477 RepID=UPI002481E659|nr:MAG: hypothetical protein QKV56_gp1 [Avonheates virus Gas_1078]UNI72592.1 MAG: hypothetical protein [Avonheates virus Gas_1078]
MPYNRTLFEPAPIMPRLVSNDFLQRLDALNFTLPNGDWVPCKIAHECMRDLYHYGHLDDIMYTEWSDALQDYVYHGIMPGQDRFYSVYTSEYVYFLEMIGDTMEMFNLAMNFWDLTDDEEWLDPAEVVMRDEDLYARPFPTNIGGFRLIPDRDCDTTLNTTDEQSI